METSRLLHPCAHLTYHKDMREEIGVIKLKDKLCLFIDGVTADKLNYVKSDMLRVDVVKIIADTFAAVGQKTMTVDELLEVIKDDEEVWNLYAKGMTQGLNQCERPASTQKCMTFKPKNIVELCAFVAAIRPGFKSMCNTFMTRTPFTYGIKSLDELLRVDGMTGVSGQSSFLLFDEQILRILIAGGIPAAEAYSTIKHIKKKHKEQVLAEKEKFKVGFSAYLKEKENASEELANDVVEKIWKIIEDSSSYLFCCAHAFAYSCDSAYGAYLKAHYPYEFYTTMLKLYTEKGNKEKIALIIDEMRRYKDITLTAGKFGQDNRDWYCDKENKTISQALSSIKFISKQAAEDLYQMKDLKFDTFVDVLWHIMMKTCLDTRQVGILIGLGYFSQFGGTKKLSNIAKSFYTGEFKLTKKIKSFEKRLEIQRKNEEEMPDEECDIIETLKLEKEMIGLCLSKDRDYAGKYFVMEVDSQYGVKIKLYNIARGIETPYLRMKKNTYEQYQLKENMCVSISKKDFTEKQRYSYKDGKRTAIPNTFDYWIESYRVA